nr:MULTISPECIES: alpha/beta fold hydrolase [unclassified Shinella]
MAGLLSLAAAMPHQATKFEPLTIQEQGSFAVGGTVAKTSGTYDNNKPTTEAQNFHGDHLYAFYQDPKPLPIVMLHGAYQSGRSWETTSDGREGFQTMFLRRHFPVYIVDQPRRGRAGNSTVAATVQPAPFDQFFRSVTPNTGPYDAGVISDAMAALFAKTGSGILFSHSQAGGPGWLTAIKSENVEGIAALEPGSGFIFPEGELPDEMPSAAGTLRPEAGFYSAVDTGMNAATKSHSRSVACISKRPADIIPPGGFS